MLQKRWLRRRQILSCRVVQRLGLDEQHARVIYSAVCMLL
jgi:hypothetical protein